MKPPANPHPNSSCKSAMHLMKSSATTNSTGIARLRRSILSLAVTAAMVCASVPSAMAAPAKGKRGAPAAAPATDGRTIALVRFSGSGGPDMRASIQSQLQEDGFTVRGVALELGDAAKKVKCKGEPTGADCLAAVGKWLNSNPKTAADFIVFGDVGVVAGTDIDIGVYDIGKGAMVERFDVQMFEQDLILSITLPQAITTRVKDHLEPQPPPTEAEQKIVAELDEGPEKTPEELAAERKAIEDAQAQAAAAQQDVVIDTDAIEVDLKEDFQAFCREGARTKRKTRDDPKDLRPKCSRGPFWGYWQPRAWVALGLTTGTLLGTGIAYGMALGARTPYKRAESDLEAFTNTVSGDPRTDPNAQCNGDGQCYDALATEVSRTGGIMRRRAIVGDVLLGTSVLLTGVLAIIIFQDRNDAKNYMKQEKGLRAISSTLRVGPIISAEQKGMGLGFRF
jgi:hypothetical protein